MNRLSARSLALAAAWLLCAPAAPAAPATPEAADGFARTKSRIDTLLKHRLKPEPLPAVLPNLFHFSGALAGADSGQRPAAGPANPRDAGGPAADSKTPAADPLSPGTDSELLERYAATLKISGTVLLNGRSHLVINQSPYKEGDLLLMGTKEAPTYIQIIRIAPGEVTLGLKDAVFLFKFKN